jgi:lipopolysaccharide biosynthesis glycosyltransferase
MTDKTCIVLSTDENFAPYVGTLLRSISRNYSGQDKLDVVILIPDSLSDQRNRFPYFRNLSISLRVPSKIDSVEFKATVAKMDPHLRFSEAALYRFFMASTCPEFGKAIYIDTDCIIYRDIQPLLDFNLGPAPLAAFHEFYLAFNSGPFRYYSDLAYFNSGVLIADLKYWRENNIEDKLLAQSIDIESDARTNFFDQDVFNLVFKNN